MTRQYDTDLIVTLATAMRDAWDTSAWDAIEAVAAELGIDEQVHNLLEESICEGDN